MHPFFGFCEVDFEMRLFARFKQIGDEAVGTSKDGFKIQLEIQAEAIANLKQISRGESIKDSRPFTRDELVVAAWGNLSVEEPQLTLERAQKMLACPT